MIFSKEHIKYTLGIEISQLNEDSNSYYNTFKLIKEEQLLYESFLDTIKDFAKDKLGKVVDTIKDWKDAAAVFFKILSSSELLKDFLFPLKRRVEKILTKLYEFLKKAGLEEWVNKIKGFFTKITSLKGWKQLFAFLSLGGISYYILEKLPKDNVKAFLSKYFTGEFVEEIIIKLTDWKTFIGWLGPIIGGVGIIFDFIKPILDQFREAFKSTSSFATKLIKENKMKSILLKETIKKEILNILKEEEVKGEKLKQEVLTLKKYLEGTGKTALSQINSPEELKSVLNIIWSGMNESFQKNPISISLKKIVDSKL
jgi:hypothetical protein